MSLGALMRQWYIVLALILVGGAAGVAFAQTAPTTYRSSGTYVVVPQSEITDTETIVRSFDSLQSQGVIPTLLELYRSESVQRDVAASTGLSTEQLAAYDITAEVLSQSNVIAVNVTGADRDGVSQMMRALGQAGAARFQELYRIYDVNALDQPSEAEITSLSTVQMAIFGAALGLLLGLAAASWRARDLQQRRPTPARAGRRTDHDDGPIPAGAAHGR